MPIPLITKRKKEIPKALLLSTLVPLLILYSGSCFALDGDDEIPEDGDTDLLDQEVMELLCAPGTRKCSDQIVFECSQRGDDWFMVQNCGRYECYQGECIGTDISPDGDWEDDIDTEREAVHPYVPPTKPDPDGDYTVPQPPEDTEEGCDGNGAPPSAAFLIVFFMFCIRKLYLKKVAQGS